MYQRIAFLTFESSWLEIKFVPPRKVPKVRSHFFFYFSFHQIERSTVSAQIVQIMIRNETHFFAEQTANAAILVFFLILHALFPM